jgi:hypothetical protein
MCSKVLLPDMAGRTASEAKPKPDVANCELNPLPQRSSLAPAGLMKSELIDVDAIN